jgi:vacuolar-type H+-ATPase subunit E/Vma4
MVLNLSIEERQILAETLANTQRSLEQQICKADYHEFRAMLRERERVLEAVLTKLNEQSMN